MMRQRTIEIPISSIILDEDIYPIKRIDHRRVGMFAENIRDGFKFDPIEVEPIPDKPGWYRLLDGAHRWRAYISTGKLKVKVLVQELNGMDQKTIHYHLGKMPVLANSLNADLSQGFTVSQVAQKHGWTEPMVWSLALEKKDDLKKFKELGWGLRAWDQWEFNACDKRFGDEWPGRIPAQLIAHILFYFSRPNDLVIDPMAGGGVTPDTCLALGHRCWSFDMEERAETRPEIESHTWIYSPDQELSWPVSSKEKADLVIFDPQYFDKKADGYGEKSISGLQRKEYLEFLEAFFTLLKQKAKKTTILAFINSDWRNFQSRQAIEETGKRAILVDDYLNILKKTGWHRSHIIQAPMSAQRFTAVVVAAMHKKRILGATGRYVIILKQEK